jgi:hypothetical protein
MNAMIGGRMPITFVISVNNREIFEDNFLASPCLGDSHPHEILVQSGFRSAADSYNDAISRSTNDLIVFAHQDIVFPASWLSDLDRALSLLEKSDPNWGVLGCYGMTADNQGRGYVYTHGIGILGAPFEHPASVQTLDEIVLILRKSSGLRFDDRLPHFHFYGAGICLAAAKRGMKSYTISAFCVHNSQLNYVLPAEFYESYKVLKRIWKDALPIQTTCIRITQFDVEMYTRRLKNPYLKHIRKKAIGAKRVKGGRKLLEQVEESRAAINSVMIPEGSTCR